MRAFHPWSQRSGRKKLGLPPLHVQQSTLQMPAAHVKQWVLGPCHPCAHTNSSVLAAGAAVPALPMDPSAEWGSEPFAALQDVVNLKGFGHEVDNKNATVSQTQH